MVDQREYDLVSRCPNVATQEYRYAILWDLVLKIFEQRYGHAYPRNKFTIPQKQCHKEPVTGASNFTA